MVERFYLQDSGSITVDGTKIEDYDIRSLRRAIGYISQEAVLFNTSIRENMLFAEPDATEDEIIDALKAASAYDFVMRLPDKLDNMVGGGGGQLSGGQKQRIAIARAFLKKPKVLLLDEATSALDKKNERAVQSAIDNYRKARGGITVIAIAHRLSTIRDADKIVVLKDGQLTEMGNHEALMKEHPDGIYAGFVAKQQSAEAQEDDAPKKKKTIVTAKSLKPKPVEVFDDEEEEEEFDPEEKEKLEQCLEKDKVEKEKFKEWEKSLAEGDGCCPGAFTRLMPYQKPICFVYFAIILAIFDGAAPPVFGFVFSKIMSVLTVPLELDEASEDYNLPKVRGDTRILCIATAAVALITFLA